MSNQMALYSAVIALLPFICYIFLTRFRRVSIAKVKGPMSDSWLYGVLPSYMRSQAGEMDFQWRSTYGDVVRIPAPLGQDYLLLSDPKALQYIYQTAGYRYPKHIERRALSKLLTGGGLTWAEGSVHQRQRKVMLPGFSTSQTKSFLPKFASCANRLSTKWVDLLADSSEQSLEVDLPSWISRATLDTIAEATFDFELGALDDDNNDLINSLKNLVSDSFTTPSNLSVAFFCFARYLPRSLLDFVMEQGSSPRLQRLRQFRQVAVSTAKSLIKEKASELEDTKELKSKDLMSLLIKANASPNTTTQLNEDEMLSQLQTMILAGHETVANSLVWGMFELCNHHGVQERLRAEIYEAERDLHQRNESQFSAKDYDSMPYLNAFLKEVLRFHPVLYNGYRQSEQDDSLPLSKPIVTATGEVLTELPIPKGQKIIASIAAYNRNEDVFGEDADRFNPERWLTEARMPSGSKVGVYANLLTFAAGIRSCIGWKFAVLEMQVFIVELVRNFEFSLSVPAEQVRREASLFMVPTLEGRVGEGSQLPFKIQLASRC